MRKSLYLLAFWVLPGSVFAAPLPETAEDDVDPDAIAEILASSAVSDESIAAQKSGDGRWVIYDALSRGFAHSPIQAFPTTNDPDLLFMHDESWLDQLESEAIAVRLRGTPAHGARDAAQHIAFDIPLADHPLVDTYIEYFTGRGRWFFERWLARADRYIPLMRPILKQKGVPEDLVYLAMIESGFSSRAVSTAAACGFWQFIGSTGKAYKLKADAWVDERRDFVRATEAAANYLTFLHKEFGDWHMAWAGYNAGEGRMRRAKAKYGTGNFWEIIAHEKSLAKETKHYVPKIIAAAIVAKDRVKYGFKVESLPPLSWDEIQVEDATSLAAVAKQFNVNVDDLRDLNPSLLFDITPPGRVSKMRVPQGRGEEIAGWLTGLSREERLSYAQHKVQKGDTLSRIADRYNTTLAAITEFNHIKSAKGLRIGQNLIIPALKSHRGVRGHDSFVTANRPDKTPRAEKARTASKKPTKKGAKVARHKVASGDTLWSIAQRYGVSVTSIKSWNNKRGNSIGVGEVLEIYAENATPET